MKKTALIVILILLTINAFCASIHFSNAGNDITGNGSVATPFATIAKLNTLTISSGDSILFRRGDVFSGQITVSTGAKYDAYGSGSIKPLITGFDQLSSWTFLSGNIYYATDVNLGSDVSLLTVNGAIQVRGRYPRTTYLTYASNTGNTSITGAALPFTITPNLSQVVIRKTHFNIDRGTITAQSGGQLTYTGTSTVNPTPNYGFFVTNDLNCLTVQNDWLYDATTHRVYIYSVGSPSGTIKASRYAFNMQFATKTNVSIKNLAFEGSNITAIGGTGNNLNCTIINCSIRNCGGDGILFQGSNGVVMRLDSFANCANQGAIVIYTNGTIFNRNFVYRSGAIAGAGANGYGSTGWGNYGAATIGAAPPSGFPSPSFNNHIDSNIVVNAGYLGLHVNGDSFTCSYNLVDTTNYILDDGSGVYSYTGPPGYTYSNRVIDHNVVMNSLGAVAGTDGAFGNQGNGIYLDDASSQVTVSNNTGFNCGRYGLYLHNAHSITATGNTFYNNALSQISMIHDNIYVPGLLTGIALSGNKFISSAGQLDLQFQSTASNSGAGDITSWGTSTNNRYGTTGGGTALFSTNVTGIGASNRTFLQWASITGTEALSSFTNLTVPQVLIELNSTLAVMNATLSNNYTDLYGTAFPVGLLSMSPMTSYYLVFSSSPPVVTPPVPSYTPSTQVYTYGTTIPNLTPSNSGDAATSWSINTPLPTGLNFNTSTGVISGTPLVTQNATTYTIGATNSAGTGNTNLSIRIVGAPLAITANLVSKVYGTALTGGSGSSAFTATGLLFGQTVGSVSIAYGGGSAANAAVATYSGTVTASAATGGTFTQSNYSITYIPGNIAVTQKALTVTATGIVKQYGTNLVAQTSNQFTAVGAISGEVVTSVLLTPSGIGTVPLADFGSPYVSNPSNAIGSGGFLASNYNISYLPFSGTVQLAPLVVTADNKTKVTLTANPALTVHYTGFQNGQNNSVLITQPTITTTAVLSSPPGSYPIVPSLASALNYSISYVNGTMVVTSVPPPPTSPPKYVFVWVFKNGRWQKALVKR